MLRQASTGVLQQLEPAFVSVSAVASDSYRAVVDLQDGFASLL
jgi:hypothetical protein